MSKRTWSRLSQTLTPTWALRDLPNGQIVQIWLTDGGFYSWHVTISDWEHNVEHFGRCTSLLMAKTNANIALNRALIASRVVTEGYVHSTLKAVLVSYEAPNLGGINPKPEKKKAKRRG